jgi:hypothetical protein
MLRASAAALLLCLVAAGCGATGWQSSAAQLGRIWGDPHPTIVRMESVQLATGTQAEVMQLRGHFSFRPSCFAVKFPGRHHRPRCPGVVHLDTVVGAVDAHDHKLIEAGNDNTAAELAAFARARDARPMFRIFPEFSDPLVQCAIPGYGGRTITGTCTTRVARGSPKTGAVDVALVEHWPLTRSSNRPYSGGWIVAVSRSGRILSVRRTGDLPPQLWRSATQPPVPRRSVTRAIHQLAYLAGFPRFPGRASCVMHGGGPRQKTLHGTCTTRILAPEGNRPRLEFVERWRLAHRAFTGGWIVTLRHDDRVLTVRIAGSNPPQSWR